MIRKQRKPRSSTIAEHISAAVDKSEGRGCVIINHVDAGRVKTRLEMLQSGRGFTADEMDAVQSPQQQRWLSDSQHQQLSPVGVTRTAT